MKICGKDVAIAGGMIRIARLAAEKFEFLDDPDEALAQLRSAARRIDLFTFTQKLPATSPNYAFPMEWDNFAALGISTYDAWWTQTIDNKTRNMVRRAEKRGVVVREVPFDDSLVDGIWKIYNETPIRQGKPFPHYGKDLDRVRREAATFLPRSIFIGAFVETTLIGFIKITLDDARTQAGIMNIVSLIEHRDKAPTNALVAGAIRSCAERQIPCLTYANFAYGNKQRDSLADFKRNNGFERVDVPRYYVPLTRLGQTALRLGLHKPLVAHVPELVLARVRGVRNAWYNRHIQDARHS